MSKYKPLEKYLRPNTTQYDNILSLFKMAVFSTRESSRNEAKNRLYKKFAFVLRRGYVKDNELLASFKSPVGIHTLYVCDVPETYNGKKTSSTPFDFHDAITNIEKLVAKAFRE